MGDAALRRLVDEAAIRDVAARYGDAVAHLDAARAAALFAEDARISIAGNQIAGRDAIRAGLTETFARFDLIRMIEHGGIVALDGDRATARWTTLELTILCHADEVNLLFGRYEDALVRVGQGWRFACRRFTLAGRARLATTRLEIDRGFAAAALPMA